MSISNFNKNTTKIKTLRLVNSSIFIQDIIQLLEKIQDEYLLKQKDVHNTVLRGKKQTSKWCAH